MKIKTFLASVLFCLQAATAAANVPLMPVQDIQPGMQGVGKTVIKGDTIEEFNAEVIGVTGSESGGYSILVRLYGDLIEKTGGVAQGMSGSPVYVDGRLLGAVAFGRAFNDPHYCFLTPIGSMLKLLDEPSARPANWLPKGTQLTAVGFTPAGMEYLQEKLAAVGLNVLAGGGSGAGSEKPLEPGSAVGVSLVQGDLTLGALGTVTWSDDAGNILAFGHPFMQRGDSGFFMNKVWILGCIPNAQSSYKVGNLGEAIGSITQDRASGIAGRVGALPSFVPVFVSASDTGRGVNSSVRLKAIEDEKLLPTIIDTAVFNTVSKTVDRNGGGTARVHFEITGVDGEKKPLCIDRENMYYAADGVLKIVTQELTEAMNILMQNKFEKVNVYNINADVEINEDVQVAEITRVASRQRKVKPGETIVMEVTLKPYRAKEFTQKIEFKVPEEHPGGKLALTVRGGSSLAWIQNLLRKQKEEGLPAQKKDTRHTLADFVKSVNDADKNNELIVDISAGGPKASPAGADKDGQMAEDAGFAGLLQGTPYKQKTSFDFIIDGESELVFDVEKNK